MASQQLHLTWTGAHYDPPDSQVSIHPMKQHHLNYKYYIYNEARYPAKMQLCTWNMHKDASLFPRPLSRMHKKIRGRPSIFDGRKEVGT